MDVLPSAPGHRARQDGAGCRGSARFEGGAAICRCGHICRARGFAAEPGLRQGAAGAVDGPGGSL